MKKLYRLTTLIILAIILTSFKDLFAGDTVSVQTLTFDDIYKRRGTWQFPNNNDTYRKILMYYTLKCDPKTPHDQYNCGEWDYLTYTMVYVHTGVMDSTKGNHPKYMLGSSAPDTIKYSSSPAFDTYKSFTNHRVADNTSNEQEFKIVDGSEDITLNGRIGRLQFILSKNDYQADSLKNQEISKIKLYFKNSGKTLRNFTIKVAQSGTKELTGFINPGFDVVYQGDLTITQEGWYEFFLDKDIKLNKILNLIFEISYESDDDTPVVIGSDTYGKSAYSDKGGTYAEFDGTNDYIDCGNIKELNNSDQLTFETWVRVDEWQNWNYIMSKGDNLLLQTGGNEGDIYCIVRNPDNTYGYAQNAIKIGEWTHLAMVYNGAGKNNEERLKLYVNGVQRTLIYRDQIPAKTPGNNMPFTISDTRSASMSLKGAVDEVRLWTKALDESAIAGWMDKPVESSHPDYSNLLAYYNFEGSEKHIAKDMSTHGYDGTFVGPPVKTSYKPENLLNAENLSTLTPNVAFIRGNYETHIDSTAYTYKKEKEISVSEFNIANHLPVIKNIDYGWEAGYEYTYDENGEKIDSTYIEPDKTVINDTLFYYQEPFEVLNPYEIGRYITPYGKGLDLGPDGFTWVYDVTDYAPLLKGMVDFSAGNLQELINVKFVFIKGTPAREVKKIDQLWGPERSYRYKDLADNTAIPEVTFKPAKGSKQFKFRARLTGHGHQSNDGSYPHCCEWRDNTHYLFVNGEEFANWHIWRPIECATNPVYPQGGTWNGAREGWCPGDVVYNYDFEITDKVKDSVMLDYAISPVPTDNLGMGNGNYVCAFQLFEYGLNSFDTDAEIYDVIAPNDFDLYSRTNPICLNPTIVIKNNGSEPLSSLSFEYGVSGGEQESYTWHADNNPIAPHKKETIMLPVPEGKFWLGDDQHKFTVKISAPNGKTDEYADNNTYETHFNMPDFYKEGAEIYFKTNLRGNEFGLTIKDLEGNYVYNRQGFDNDALIKIPLNYEKGCYTLELTDPAHWGLSYWAVAQQGDGYFQIRDKNGNMLKNFNPDFGAGIFYSFDLGSFTHVEDQNLDNLINVYPNPAGNYLNIGINYNIGYSKMYVTDIMGNLIFTENVYVGENFTKRIDLDKLAPGSYHIRFVNDKYDIKKSFVKK